MDRIDIEREIESGPIGSVDPLGQLEGEKEMIQQITREEMNRLRLHKYIQAQRNNRGMITQDNVARDKKGNPVYGQRLQQNYFVSEKQIMNRVLKRLNLPPEAFQAAEQVRAEEEEAKERGNERDKEPVTEREGESDDIEDEEEEEQDVGQKDFNPEQAEQELLELYNINRELDTKAPPVIIQSTDNAYSQSIATGQAYRGKRSKGRNGNKKEEEDIDWLIRQAKAFDQRQQQEEQKDNDDFGKFIANKGNNGSKKKSFRRKRKTKK